MQIDATQFIVQQGFFFLLGWFSRDVVELIKTHYHKKTKNTGACDAKKKSKKQ